MKLFCILLSMIFVCGKGLSQIQDIAPYTTKSIAFISLKKGEQPIGTGFFIDNPESKELFLVTAKHVIKDKCVSGKFKLRDSIHIRLFSKHSHKYEDRKVELIKKGNLKVYFHPMNPSIDLAVIPLKTSDFKKYDILSIPKNLIISKRGFDSLNIRVGDEVFFTALFYQIVGKNKFYPVTRYGRIASIPEDSIRIDDVCNNPVFNKFLLIDAMVTPGNSGAPVFIFFSVIRDSIHYSEKKGTLSLGGIIQGYYFDTEKVDTLAAQASWAYARANAGISIVVPSYQLLDILNSLSKKTKIK
jgi:hypothetical protein